MEVVAKFVRRNKTMYLSVSSIDDLVMIDENQKRLFMGRWPLIDVELAIEKIVKVCGCALQERYKPAKDWWDC